MKRLLLALALLASPALAQRTPARDTTTVITIGPRGSYTPVVPIPAGNNNIGDVDVASLPPLPAGSNIIGAVTISGTPTVNLGAGSSSIGVSSLPALPAGANAIGSVSVSNFPATQPVSGTVAVSSLPTVTLGAGSASIGTVVNGPGSNSIGTVGLNAGVNAIGSVSVSNFPATQPVSGTVAVSSLPTIALGAGANAIGSVSVSNFPATQPVSGTVAVSSLPTISLGTGTNSIGNLGTVTAVTAITNALPAGSNTIGGVNIISQPTLTKGTQGATGLTVQALKDAGRTPWHWWAEAVAGAASEALVSMTTVTAIGTAGVAATTYTVPAGKTLRIQQCSATFVATTTTANTTKLRLRAVATGTAVIGSPVLLSLPRLGWPSATFIANEVSPPVVIPFPDNAELPAATSFGLTHVEAAANGTLDVYCSGFLY